jgi:hypothetical protein
VVDRVYEAVDDPGDVSRDADGTWHIRAGATVRVRLTMVADARRTHVALVDPLPAGLEPVNPALEVSQTFPPEESSGDAMTPEAITPEAMTPEPMTWCWCWQWFEHQNMRDDRVEAFTSYLAGGVRIHLHRGAGPPANSSSRPPQRSSTPRGLGRSPPPRW